MKKVFSIIVFFGVLFAHGQQKVFSNELAIANNSTAEDKFKPLDIDFAYYSKNYKKVFGEYIFMLDSNNFGARNVYVGYDTRLYYQDRSTFIMEYPGPHSTNYSWNADYIEGLIAGVKLLFDSEKDYTKSYSDYNK